MIYKLLMILLLLACGSETVNKRSGYNKELEELRTQVTNLSGTLAQINAFTASDFSNCGGSLPPFETKICNIAKTATAEQAILFSSQLQEFSKIMQTTIYGENCTSEVEIGCPAPSSIMDRIVTAESNISDAQADIVALQGDILVLQGDVSSLNSRLNNFNGSGNSVEVVITGIQADISALDNRIDAVEGTLNNGDVYKTVTLCGNIPISGPLYEAALVTGDNQKVVSYIQSGTNRGLGVISEAGVTGTVFRSTALNTRVCNFKIYDLSTTVKICWNKTNRQANSGNIDIACDAANNFASPTVDCTCAN